MMKFFGGVVHQSHLIIMDIPQIKYAFILLFIDILLAIFGSNSCWSIAFSFIFYGKLKINKIYSIQLIIISPE